jgi:predicted ATPase/class 3 adenylate cyclase
MAELPSGTVTFLFTDVEGSTRLWEEHPEAMRSALARHDEILRGAVAAHRGSVVKTTGDGLHAAFVTASDATTAAIDAQCLLLAEPWPLPDGLRVRMGLHTGHAEIREADYYGPAVNRAARVAAAAHGGQIVLSHATEELVCDALPAGVKLLDLGEHRFRDLSRPERMFQVCASGLVHEFPALRSLDAFPGNLPVQVTSFVGRDEDVAALARMLIECRLVTLTGVGGVGKTRLAVQAAAAVLPRFADGVWLCELAATNDADLLGQVLVAALGVQPRAGRSLVESVCDHLAGKQALIVLDNCEHLLDAAAAIAEAMLQAAPAVRVLATSRELLGVGGERVVGVPSLSIATESSIEAIAACEAVRLFVDRAGATRSGFRVTSANAEQIAEICRRLDGIPLAIELAAARATSMAPGEIAALLDERFRLLTGGRRRGVERQQTLRATVEWSYALLDERDRVVFDRLGVFAGSFDAAAATAVAGHQELTAWDVRDALDDLAAKSMVVLDESSETGTRFRLLETLRQYALERLDDTGAAEEHRRYHAEHYARFAEAAGPGLEGPEEVTWAQRFDAELDNLRAAVAWALDTTAASEGELGLRIIAALSSQANFRPSIGVGEWAESAVARAESSNRGRRTAVLTAAAFRAFTNADLPLMRLRAAQALSDGFAVDTPSPASAYVALTVAEAFAGDHEAALQAIAAGRQALDTITVDEFAENFLLVAVAAADLLAGRYDEAHNSAEHAVERARPLANPSGLILALFYFAWTRRPNESEDTIRALEECLDLGRAVATPYRPHVLRALALLAKLHARRGERIPAIEDLRQAIVGAHDSGQLIALAVAANHGVSVAVDLDAWELAATLGTALTEGPLRGTTLLVHPAEHADRNAALDRAQSQLAPDRYHAALNRGTTLTYEQLIEYTLTQLDWLLTKTNEQA